MCYNTGMTLEELTKTQLVLLTLLISFVSSIATSVITTGLLAEAPLQTTQTINRIVQNTVEKVIPGEVVTNENTIIKVESNEGDLIAKIYEEVVPMIYFVKDEDGKEVSGFSIDSNIFVYASQAQDLRMATIKDGETVYDLSSEKHVSNISVSSLKDDVAILANSLKVELSPKIGETVIMIDPIKFSLYDSRISSVNRDLEGNTVSISTTDKIVEVGVGSIVLDLEGSVIGFVATNVSGELYVVPAEAILSL